MKSLMSLALLAIALPAFADIPAPPTNKVQTLTVEGQDAADLGEALEGKYEIEAPLRTSSTSTKVFYSSTGLTQIVCTKTVSYVGKPEYNSCLVQQSKDGKKLKKYVRIMRMG